jgi:phosphoglycerol transferase
MIPGLAPPVAEATVDLQRHGTLGERVRAGGGHWGAAIAVGLLALAAAALLLRVWRADFAAPFRYSSLDDTKFYLALIRSVVRDGWFGAGSSLGAPFGQNLADFPQGADNLNFAIIRGLAVFSSNPGLIANLFFLLTFPLAAASAFLVMVKLGLARGPALVAAVLFALLPYHFYRNESHLLLSAYYSIPLSAYLFLSIFLGDSRFQRRTVVGRRALAWLSGRTVRTVLLCAIIASSGLYYAAFALVLLSSGLLVALLVRRPRAVLASALGCVLLVGVFLTANLAPSLIYRAEHGPNPLVVRSLTDTELLGLKPAQLLLPVQGHRLPLLHDINRNYARADSSTYCEQCYETLGSVGDVGFLWLLAGALAAILGAGGLLARSRLYRPAALGVLLSLLIASVGGFSSLLAYVLTPNVRGWNRMSLFIAFFSLLAAACLVQAGLRALARRRAKRYWPALAVIALLVLGVLDETSNDFIPSYKAARVEYRSDGVFFGEVQSRLGAGAAVFELPYVPFPEGYGDRTTSLGFTNPNFGTTYEEMRGYITSTSLRWSYGAMKGRAADWEGELASKPLALAVAAASLSGFQGLVIEPGGYQAAPAALLGTLRGLLGEAPLISPRGDLWFFDLRPYAARLGTLLGGQARQEVSMATLDPLRVRCSSSGVTLSGGSGTRPVTATLTFSVSDPNPPLGPLTVSFPDGSSQEVPVAPGGAAIARQLRLEGRSGAVRFLTATPVPAAYSVQVLAPTLTAQAYGPLMPSSASPIQAGYLPPSCEVHPAPSPRARTVAP